MLAVSQISLGSLLLINHPVLYIFGSSEIDIILFYPTPVYYEVIIMPILIIL
jgi:hypothetical protein